MNATPTQRKSPLALIAGFALLAACSQQPDTTPTLVQTTAQPAQADTSLNAHAAALQQALRNKPTSAVNTGVVLSTDAAAGYSYIRVKVDSNEVWLASTQADVKPGDTISWGDYAVMRDFTSKTLNRTFPVILFVSKVVPGHAAAPSTHSGRVVAVTTGGGYSFLEVESGGVKEWLAAPETPLKVGDRITWDGGAMMSNFASKSLNRTFDKIVFVAGVNVVAH